MSRTPEKTERNRKIANMVDKGYTQQEIANQFGISQQRVNQISKREAQIKSSESIDTVPVMLY